MGTVTNNKDPLDLDRIQVAVPQLYDPDLGELPWVGCSKDSAFGQGDTWGVHGAPAVGSSVVIELQRGDSHYPICTGSLKRKSAPGFKSGVNWGFVDPAGNTLNVNLATKEIKFTSSGGMVIQIDSGGNVKTTSAQWAHDGNLSTTGNVDVGTGASGTFTAASGQTITVTNGIVTRIV